MGFWGFGVLGMGMEGDVNDIGEDGVDSEEGVDDDDDDDIIVSSGL